MSSHATQHDLYLERLINGLDDVGECRENIEWVMRDGIWKYNESYDYHKLCDLILGHYPTDEICEHWGSVVELKGSWKQRSKAKAQLESGRQFCETVLEVPCVYGTLVVYDEGVYGFERYDFL